VAIAEMGGGFRICLDGRDLRTPAGQLLVIPEDSLAEAIAAEWSVQGDFILPASMPLTRLACTAIDRVAPRRAAVVDQMMEYAATDLLCYRTLSPRDLMVRQEIVWQPVVDWAAVILGADLAVTSGVVPVPQPAAALQALRQVVEGYADLPLTALQSAVATMGSLLLGIALAEGRLSADEAFAASQLDETYQNELWGEDAEAVRAREGRRNDVAAAARVLASCVRADPRKRQ
jgi:chaperone required for assembly of F1-ATPase